MSYRWRRAERLAVDAALRSRQPGARALLLEGPPGCGKSSLAAAIAAEQDAPLIVEQLHAWTSAEDLFVGVDVVAAVEGDARRVRQPGVLGLVASASREGQVVVLLDEIDKAREAVDALLLDVLESGRVPVQPGVHARIDLSAVLWVLTSNGERGLAEALQRRCRLVRMSHLSASEAAALVAERTGCTQALAALAWSVAREAREGVRGAAPISPAEVARMLEELVQVSERYEDALLCVAAWTRNDRPRRAETLWGQVVAWKQQA